MQGFTVEAKSLGSAQALYTALSEFHPELTGSEQEGYQVRISLGNDREIVAVLDMLEKHITDRADGPARVELDGRRYTMHAPERYEEETDEGTTVVPAP